MFKEVFRGVGSVSLCLRVQNPTLNKSLKAVFLFSLGLILGKSKVNQALKNFYILCI